MFYSLDSAKPLFHVFFFSLWLLPSGASVPMLPEQARLLISLSEHFVNKNCCCCCCCHLTSKHNHFGRKQHY